MWLNIDHTGRYLLHSLKKVFVETPAH
jgi:hypothetical protein